jgi:tellurite resistance protein
VSVSHETIVRAACCIAAADGDVTSEEEAALCKLAGGVDCKDLLKKALTSPAFLEEALECVAEDPEEAMKTLLVVAAADGMLSDGERLLINHFAARFQVNEEVLRRLRRGAEEGNRTE